MLIVLPAKGNDLVSKILIHMYACIVLFINSSTKGNVLYCGVRRHSVETGQCTCV
jgi:hypothetical protein